jgi:FlaA1/EpsC-like NDP-sugar epimerase
MFDSIQEIATGRSRSLFASDVYAASTQLAETIQGARVLAIGAAGSIGSNTIMEMVRHNPKALHIVDQNENALAELVRLFRSQPTHYAINDLRALPLDYGSRAMQLFLASGPTYDIVVNFAAIKHVRSEKDAFSTLQMLDTNIVKQARLMAWLAATGFCGRFFTVSTDKAANPSSMMGATKRVMEHVMFNTSIAHALEGTKTAARFANVAFSNGSLLQGFQNRLARVEPLAAPRDTRRYFVSLEESGQLCMIAACLAPDNSIVIPRLDPAAHLVLLEEIAQRFLQAHGYEAVIYEDESAACADVKTLQARRQWPLLLTPLDTAGEKPYEEFMTDKEQAFEFGSPNLRAVKYLEAPRQVIDSMLERARDLVSLDSIAKTLDKDEIKHIVGSVEPDFLMTHRESPKNLDERL